MSYHLHEELARAKVAEVERNAADPGRRLARELRLARAPRRWWRSR